MASRLKTPLYVAGPRSEGLRHKMGFLLLRFFFNHDIVDIKLQEVPLTNTKGDQHERD